MSDIHPLMKILLGAMMLFGVFLLAITHMFSSSWYIDLAALVLAITGIVIILIGLVQIIRKVFRIKE